MDKKFKKVAPKVDKSIISKFEEKESIDEEKNEIHIPKAEVDSVKTTIKRRKCKLESLSDEEKKERQIKQIEEWRNKNNDYSKEARKKYYAENKEEILAKRRQKRLEEKEIIRKYKELLNIQ